MTGVLGETPAPEDAGGAPGVDTTAPPGPGRPAQPGPRFLGVLGTGQFPAEHGEPDRVSDFEGLPLSCYLDTS